MNSCSNAIFEIEIVVEITLRLQFEFLIEDTLIIWSNLPSQSITMGLFAALYVLRTKTAFVAGDVVVAGTVAVVISGAVVVPAQG